MKIVRSMCVAVAVVFMTLPFSACKQQTGNASVNEKQDSEVNTGLHASATTISDDAGSAIAGELPTVLPDTAGVFEIENQNARQFIVDLNLHLWKISNAIDKKDTENLPVLMTELTRYHDVSVYIESTLSMDDKALFGTYTTKASRKISTLRYEAQL